MVAKKKKISASVVSTNCITVKLDSKDYFRKLNNALYYAHYEFSNKKLATETIAWAKRQDEFKKVPFSVLPDYEFAIVGKYCYVLNNGGELDAETTDRITSMVRDLVVTAHDLQKEKNKKDAGETVTDQVAVISIQDRLRMKAEEVCAEFEGEIDALCKDFKSYDLKTFKPDSVFVSEELKAGHLRYVIKFYQPCIDELEEYLKGECDQLKEGYDYLGKAGVNKLLKMYRAIVDSANMVITATKATRKPPKRKAVPITKIIEKLKYLKQDSELKLASINPADIIGAKVLWFYNTKSRKVGYYEAFDETGLSIKSTSITGYSEDNSKQKTLRKPVEQLKQFKGTKAGFEKAFDGVKSIDTKVSPRPNEHVILLKVIK